jgi:hypothetical protein
MKMIQIEEIKSNLVDGAVILDNCDEAIMGATTNGVLVYSHTKLVEVFKKQGMSEEESIDWIDYNVIPLENIEKGFILLYEY